MAPRRDPRSRRSAQPLPVPVPVSAAPPAPLRPAATDAAAAAILSEGTGVGGRRHHE